MQLSKGICCFSVVSTILRSAYSVFFLNVKGDYFSNLYVPIANTIKYFLSLQIYNRCLTLTNKYIVSNFVAVPNLRTLTLTL